jgi:hypothetical protein
MSDMLLASEVVHPGAGDSLDPDRLGLLDADLLEASRATADRGVCDWNPIVDWLIERDRWRTDHKRRLCELIFDVWEGLEPAMQRQIRDDARKRKAS